MTTCTSAGCGRKFGLLFHPEPWCAKHTPPDQRELLADLATRARAIGIKPPDAWPYGPNVDVGSRSALIAWAEHEGLRYSPRASCLHWITRGRCAVQLCREDRNQHRWMDHVTGWVREGKPAVLVAQPYGVFTRDVADLAAVSERWQLKVTINGTGWYGHGTTFVELRVP